MSRFDKAVNVFAGLAVVALIVAAAVLGLNPRFTTQTALAESAPQTVSEPVDSEKAGLERTVIEKPVAEQPVVDEPVLETPVSEQSEATPTLNAATPATPQPITQAVDNTGTAAQPDMTMQVMAQAPAAPAGQAAAQPLLAQGNVDMIPDVSYTLTTGLAEGKLVFIGVGGSIDGVINPELHAEPNSVVQLTLIDGDGAQHDWSIPELNAKTDYVTGKGSSSVTVFQVGEDGVYSYFCTVPGHRAAGMEGQLIVGQGAADETSDLPKYRARPDRPARPYRRA